MPAQLCASWIQLGHLAHSVSARCGSAQLCALGEHPAIPRRSATAVMSNGDERPLEASRHRRPAQHRSRSWDSPGATEEPPRATDLPRAGHTPGGTLKDKALRATERKRVSNTESEVLEYTERRHRTRSHVCPARGSKSSREAADEPPFILPQPSRSSFPSSHPTRSLLAELFPWLSD